MSLLNIVPAFALTALVLAMVPGQGVAMVLRQTLTGGARGAMASVVGNSSGLIAWGVASSVGLSQVFAHSPLAYNTPNTLAFSISVTWRPARSSPCARGRALSRRTAGPRRAPSPPIAWGWSRI